MKLDYEDDPTNNNPSIHSAKNNPYIHLVSIHPFTSLTIIHTYIHSTITLRYFTYDRSLWSLADFCSVPSSLLPSTLVSSSSISSSWGTLIFCIQSHHRWIYHIKSVLTISEWISQRSKGITNQLSEWNAYMLVA